MSDGTMVSGGRDSVILLWGDESDEPKATIPTYEPLEGALIRNDHIYTIGTRGTKILFNLATPRSNYLDFGVRCLNICKLQE